jgi:hypothetical protein
VKEEKNLHKDYAPKTGNFEKDATLYPVFDSLV